MGMKRIVAITGLGVILAAASATAHHAFSQEFDADKPVKLVGTITKAEWVNPHAWVYLDVKGEDGKVLNWSIELGPPNALLRRGWKKSSMPVGAQITIEGFAAKNGKEFASANDITLPDGTKVFAASDTPRQ
jgi:Family of unknown function (DUF6152)